MDEISKLKESIKTLYRVCNRSGLNQWAVNYNIKNLYEQKRIPECFYSRFLNCDEPNCWIDFKNDMLIISFDVSDEKLGMLVLTATKEDYQAAYEEIYSWVLELCTDFVLSNEQPIFNKKIKAMALEELEKKLQSQKYR